MSAQAARPKEIGPHRITGEFGRGEMGVVYRASGGGLGPDEVALKVIRSDRAIGREEYMRFKREFRALARLEHPNVVRAYDMGNEDGRLYFAMEAVEGSDLHAWLDDQPPGEPRRVSILRAFLQIFAALDYMHGQGIVHRDLKPGNVLVTDDGVVKLTDFGLARDHAEAHGLTRSGLLVGTVAYMAPEQINAERNLDSRADLYAAGVMLFEALCGRLPFPQESLAALLQAHLTQSPPDLRRCGAPWAPASLAELLRRLLGKTPAERPPTGRAVFRALGEAAEKLGGDAPAVPVGPWQGAAMLEKPAEFAFRSVLSGRAGEIERLGTALVRAREGRGGVVLIEGEAGLGKSRLASELSEMARWEGFRTLRGVHRQESSLSYEGISSVLRGAESLLRRMGEKERRAILGDQGRLLAALAPELLALPGLADLPPTPDLHAREAQRALIRSIAAFLAELARHRPLVVELEDIHWADEETVSLLDENLALAGTEGARAFPLLIVATMRSHELPESHHISTGIEALRSKPDLLAIPLRPLDGEALRGMLESLVGKGAASGELAKHVSEVSGGNPFFAEELIRGLLLDRTLREDPVSGELELADELDPDAVPKTLSSVLATRLGDLGENELLVVRAIALAYAQPSFDLLLAVTGLDEDPLLDLLDGLLRRRILDEEREGFRFRHALLRAEVARAISTPRRRRLHRRLAEATEALHRDAQPAPLGRHLRDGGRKEEAVPHLIRAAEEAAKRWGFLEAIGLYREAAKLGELSFGELIDLCRFEFETGLVDEARARAAGIVERAGREGATEFHGKALLFLAHVCMQRAENESARAHLEEAVALLSASEQSYSLAEARRLLGELLMRGGAMEEARVHLERAIEESRRIREHPEITASSLRSLARFHRFRGKVHEALPLIRESLRICEEHEIPKGRMHALAELGAALSVTQDLEGAKRALEEAAAAFEAQHQVLQVCNTLCTLGYVHLQRDDLSAARSALNRALDISRSEGVRSMEVPALAALGEQSRRAGRLDEAEKAYAEGLRLAESIGHADGRAVCTLGLGEVAFHSGDWSPALEHAERAVDLFREQKRVDALATALVLRAAVVGAKGDQATALETADEAAELAEKAALTGAIAQAQGERARILGRQGRSAEARSALDTALRAAAEEHGPSARVACLLERIRLEIRCGGWTEAIGALTEARRLDRLRRSDGGERSQVGAVAGQCSLALGDFRDALVQLESATHQSAESGERPAMIETAVHWADALTRLGRADEADERLRFCRREDLAQCAMESPALAAELALCRAELLDPREAGEKVVASIAKSRRLSRKAGDRHLEARADLAEARALIESGEPAASLALAQRAIEIAEEIDSQRLLWIGAVLAGAACLLLGDLGAAREHAIRAARIFEAQVAGLPESGSYRSSFASLREVGELRRLVARLRSEDES